MMGLARHLAGQGHEVHVVCAAGARSERGQFVEQGVTVHRLWPIERPGGLRRVVDHATWLGLLGWACLRRSGSTDVVIVMSTTLPLSLYARLMRLVSFGRVRHANWVLDLMAEAKFVTGRWSRWHLPGRLLRWMTDVGLRAADLNVVLGRCMRQKLRGKGVADERMVEIGPWSSGKTVTPNPQGATRLRSEWGLDGKFVLLYAGYRGPWHRVAGLRKALSALGDVADVHVAFVGSGDDDLPAFVAEHALKYVSFHPRVSSDQLGDMLGLADAHLITQNPDFLGMCVPSKIYGAMASGRPILFIGPSESQAAIDVRESACGYCVEPGDEGGVVEAVVSLRRDSQRCEVMGAAGREHFERCFDLTRRCEAWEDAIHSMIGPAATTVMESTP